MVIFLAPVLVLIVSVVLGVYAGVKIKPVLIVLLAVVLTVLSYIFVYKMTLLPVQYSHMGPGSERIPFQKTAVDFAVAQLLADYATIGAMIAYAVGCTAGLLRKKRTADAPSY